MLDIISLIYLVELNFSWAPRTRRLRVCVRDRKTVLGEGTLDKKRNTDSFCWGLKIFFRVKNQ